MGNSFWKGSKRFLELGICQFLIEARLKSALLYADTQNNFKIHIIQSKLLPISNQDPNHPLTHWTTTSFFSLIVYLGHCELSFFIGLLKHVVLFVTLSFTWSISVLIWSNRNEVINGKRFFFFLCYWQQISVYCYVSVLVLWEFCENFMKIWIWGWNFVTVWLFEQQLATFMKVSSSPDICMIFKLNARQRLPPFAMKRIYALRTLPKVFKIKNWFLLKLKYSKESNCDGKRQKNKKSINLYSAKLNIKGPKRINLNFHLISLKFFLQLLQLNLGLGFKI